MRRDQAETELVRAISRYIGYTTGAFSLQRVVGLTELLLERPFRYEVEVSALLQKEHGIRSNYARGVIDFAGALGLVQRRDVGQQARLTITDLGRARNAAVRTSSAAFAEWILKFAILEHDADMYGLMLDYKMTANEIGWGEGFADRLTGLRQQRLEWLEQALKAELLVARIRDQVKWLEPYGRKTLIKDEINSHFLRHHTRPREGWAKELGHLNGNGKLTSDGEAFVQALRFGRSHYLWIGPSEEAAAALGLKLDEVPSPLGPAWNLLRPGKGGTQEVLAPSTIVTELADYMEAAYPAIRLIRTNQAPIAAVRPYIFWLEHQSGTRFEHQDLLKRVFAQNRTKLVPMTGRGGGIVHYQMRVVQ